MLQMDRYAGPEPRLHAGGMPEGLDAYLCGQALQRNIKNGLSSTLLFIARDDARAAAFQAASRYFHPELKTLHIPAWDILPYDRISPAKSLAAKRARGLFTLTKWKAGVPLVVVTTVAAISQKVAPRDVISKAGFVLKPGKTVDRDALLAYLTDNGFSRTASVMDPGDYAVRGGLIDLFPPGNSRPVRLDFFGDEIETLRRFDVETQRSTEKLARLILSPVSEVLMRAVQTTHFRTSYIETFGGGIGQDPMYAQVKDGIRPQGIEKLLAALLPAIRKSV